MNRSSSHTGISEGEGMDELHAAEEPMATGEKPDVHLKKMGQQKLGKGGWVWKQIID